MRHVTRLVLAAVVVLLAGGCSDDPGDPTVTAPPSTSPVRSPAAAATTQDPAAAGPTGLPSGGNGCPRNNGRIPAGARTVTTADLDLDGEADTLWLANSGGTRRLGVRTASGTTFSTTFQSASPQAASAFGQKLDYPGPAVILLDTGRAVQLFTVVNCKVVPTRNIQGDQYTFDLGFTGYGTGVACVPPTTKFGPGGATWGPHALLLAGLLATPAKTGGGYAVYRTPIILSGFGKEARNGTRQTLALHAGADSALVKQARTVTCGTGNARVTEPGSR